MTIVNKYDISSIHRIMHRSEMNLGRVRVREGKVSGII